MQPSRALTAALPADLDSCCPDFGPERFWHVVP
jgi:hypothetical protein